MRSPSEIPPTPRKVVESSAFMLAKLVPFLFLVAIYLAMAFREAARKDAWDAALAQPRARARVVKVEPMAQPGWRTVWISYRGAGHVHRRSLGVGPEAAAPAAGESRMVSYPRRPEEADFVQATGGSYEHDASMIPTRTGMLVALLSFQLVFCAPLFGRRLLERGRLADGQITSVRSWGPWSLVRAEGEGSTARHLVFRKTWKIGEDCTMLAAPNGRAAMFDEIWARRIVAPEPGSES